MNIPPRPATPPPARNPQPRQSPLVTWRPDWWQRRHLVAVLLVILVPIVMRAFTPMLGPRDHAFGGLLMIFGPLLAAAGTFVYGWFVRTHLQALRPDEVAADPPPAVLGDDAFAFSRNPHWLGVIAFVLAQAAWVESTPLTLYALALPFALHGWVVLREEPELRARLGPEFDEHAMRVPRWLPWDKIVGFLREIWQALKQMAGRG